MKNIHVRILRLMYALYSKVSLHYYMNNPVVYYC
jgi:hypothetical protein